MSGPVAALDWTVVLEALIAGLPAIIGAIAALSIRNKIKTPSGAKIGEVMEKTHDLTAADLAVTTQVHGHIKGTTPIPPLLAPPGQEGNP